jgi:hypothetical protein
MLMSGDILANVASTFATAPVTPSRGIIANKLWSGIGYLQHLPFKHLPSRFLS